MAKVSQLTKLEEILKKELNTTKLHSSGLASGGCINEGQSYDTDYGKVFVKVNANSEVPLIEFRDLRCSPAWRGGNLLFYY